MRATILYPYSSLYRICHGSEMHNARKIGMALRSGSIPGFYLVGATAHAFTINGGVLLFATALPMLFANKR